MYILGKTSGRLIISQYGLLCVSTKQVVVKMSTHRYFTQQKTPPKLISSVLKFKK